MATKKPTTDAPQEQSPVQPPLVPMEKDGSTLDVHPTCVQAHVKAGWKVVG